MDDAERLEIEEHLKRQIEAYHEGAMVYTAVTAHIPDLVKLGCQTPEMLASELDMQPEPLRRFLRGLVTMRLCKELEDGRFVLTPAGESLAVGSHSALRFKAEVVVGQYWLSWVALKYSLETGKPAFDQFFGMTISDWRAAEKEGGEPFYRYLAKEEMKAENADDLMQSFDVIEEGDILASIGGGYGGFLVPFLIGLPEIKAIVFDTPKVADDAEPMFQAFGLQDRVTFVAGDILKGIPVEADIYFLKGVLQQHDDGRAQTILENCRAAMKPGARLIVFERLMPENAMDDPAAIMLDLHMMAIAGGKARTKAEMETLIAEAGLTIAEDKRTYGGLTFIDVRRPESEPQP